MTDQGVLREQYSDGARLSARQSLWQHRSGPSLHQTVITDHARSALAAAFDNVVVHDAGGAFPVLDPAIVVSYLASWPPEALGLRSGPVWDAVLAEMSRLVHAVLIAR